MQSKLSPFLVNLRRSGSLGLFVNSIAIFLSFALKNNTAYLNSFRLQSRTAPLLKAICPLVQIETLATPPLALPLVNLSNGIYKPPGSCWILNSPLNLIGTTGYLGLLIKSTIIF